MTAMGKGESNAAAAPHMGQASSPRCRYLRSLHIERAAVRPPEASCKSYPGGCATGESAARLMRPRSEVQTRRTLRIARCLVPKNQPFPSGKPRLAVPRGGCPAYEASQLAALPGPTKPAFPIRQASPGSSARRLPRIWGKPARRAAWSH